MKDVLTGMLLLFIVIFFGTLIGVTAIRLALIVVNNIVGVFA